MTSSLNTEKLRMTCPHCASTEIVYSCEPKCCFNHVCADCRTSFQAVTEATGERLAGAIPPEPPPDCTEPTTACEKCESTAVYVLDDGKLVCTACGAMLRLTYTEIDRNLG
jgi:hypothetical protein